MINIVMSCYVPDDVPERGQYAVETSKRLFHNLFSSESISLILADDGSNDLSYVHEIRESWGEQAHCVQVKRKGIGGSLNHALSFVPRDEMIMYITDDWVLQRTLNLSTAIKLIRDEGYDYVRLGPLHPNIHCKVKFNNKWWLELNQALGGFVFATRPFLCTKDFLVRVGPFKEGVDAYVTEQDYAERVAQRPYLRMAALLDNFDDMWTHIGEKEVGRIQPSLAVV